MKRLVVFVLTMCLVSMMSATIGCGKSSSSAKTTSAGAPPSTTAMK